MIMKIFILQIVLCLAFSISFAQSPNDIDKYLAKKYTYEASVSVGTYFYTGEELPKIYNNVILKKILPDITIYSFVINERGCYGATPRIGLILEKDGKLIEQFGLWSIVLDKDFNPEFTNLFKEVKVKSNKDFDAYLNSIAKLLFSTYYQNDFELSKRNNTFQTFISKENGSIKFEFLNSCITNVKYIMSF